MASKEAETTAVIVLLYSFVRLHLSKLPWVLFSPGGFGNHISGYFDPVPLSQQPKTFRIQTQHNSTMLGGCRLGVI